jgi:hypothetical protein
MIIIDQTGCSCHSIRSNRTVVGMTLEQLRIFVAVAEREHVTRGAVALNLTPSAPPFARWSNGMASRCSNALAGGSS